jgi:hypothetical protein
VVAGSGRRMELASGAYWSVSVRYVRAARCANSDTSGRLSGYASPDANMIIPGASCAAVLGAMRDARAAYRSAGACAGCALIEFVMDVSFTGS